MSDRVDIVVLSMLSRLVGGDHAQTVLTRALRRMGAARVDPVRWDTDELCRQLRMGLSLFALSSDVDACIRSLKAALLDHRPTDGAQESAPARTYPIESEGDIVTVRAAARELCAQIGFGTTDQVKVATVVSELARNITQYAGSGEIVLTPLAAPARGIEVLARDSGPGIAHLDVVLSGSYRSRTGLGRGLVGSRQIMDELVVDTDPERGTTVRARKRVRS